MLFGAGMSWVERGGWLCRLADLYFYQLYAFINPIEGKSYTVLMRPKDLKRDHA